MTAFISINNQFHANDNVLKVFSFGMDIYKIGTIQPIPVKARLTKIIIWNTIVKLIRGLKTMLP